VLSSLVGLVGGIIVGRSPARPVLVLPAVRAWPAVHAIRHVLALLAVVAAIAATTAVAYPGLYVDGGVAKACSRATYQPYYSSQGIGACIKCSVGVSTVSIRSSAAMDCSGTS